MAFFRLTRAILPLLAFAFALTVEAADIARAHRECATDSTVALQQAHLPHRRFAPFKAIQPAIRLREGVYVVDGDPSILPFDHPFDLADSSLHLKRIDAQTFEVTRSASQFDGSVGTLLRTFSREEVLTASTLKVLPFAFPFYGRELTRLYVSPTNALLPDGTLQTRYSSQQTAFDAVARRQPIISPLYQPAPIGETRVFVRESPDSLLITWISSVAGDFIHQEVQARLEANGDITFSYGRMHNAEWGSVIVTSGAEAFYTSETKLVSVSDATGDVQSSASFRTMLDITSVDVVRIGGSDLLEFRIHTKASISRRDVPSPRQLLFEIRFDSGDDHLSLFATADAVDYLTPDLEPLSPDSGWSIAGNVVTLRALESMIPPDARSFTVRTADVSEAERFSEIVQYADTVSGALTLGASTPAQSDFSSVSSPVQLQRPIFEAFTVPDVNLETVWGAVRNSDPSLTNQNVDAVAVYENFMSNVYTFADAYALQGNPGASGISPQSTQDRPISPTLLQMDGVGYPPNRDPQLASFVLAHEFGHRWLYLITIRDGGRDSGVLNPDGAHPAQYVDTTSAFHYESDVEGSVMGGTHFVDAGNSMYDTQLPRRANSYSWHELYLMGLARADEVAPWFYLADTVPALGTVYFPPAGVRVSATRHDVNVQQIIDSIGPRIPAYDGQPKTFRVIFVLVERPASPATDDEVRQVGTYATAFARRFSAITGNRAHIAPLVAGTPLTASFDVPSRVFAGSEARFNETASGDITQWRWDFGDGKTSSYENPLHVFSAAGTYAVTLTVGDGLQTKATTRNVVVANARKRPVR